MISMAIYLKNGQKLDYSEINKVQVKDNSMTLSTFKGQYAYVKLEELSTFELKYPQSKAPKAYAIFKQVVTKLGGDIDVIDK